MIVALRAVHYINGETDFIEFPVHPSLNGRGLLPGTLKLYEQDLSDRYEEHPVR